MRELPPGGTPAVWRRFAVSAARKGWEVAWTTGLLSLYLTFLSELSLAGAPRPAADLAALFRNWVPVAVLIAAGVIFLTEDWGAAGEDVSRE